MGSRHPVEQGREQGTVSGLEPDPLTLKLAVQDGELVAQYEDLGGLVAVAAGHQPQ
jgi:hypothetical protein